MRAPRLLGGLAAKSASAQVVIAGTYAWAVTVAPVVGYRGAPAAAKGAACAALAMLLCGAATERWWKGAARFVTLAGFVAASTLAWLLAPAVLRPLAIDTPQGLAGMFGWALFALASAGPARGERREPARVVEGAPLEMQRKPPRGDSAYLVGGTTLALVLQGLGWDIAEPERALLVRLVALAAGLAVIGASTEIALARHARREKRSVRARLRHAWTALALLGVLALSGLLLAARG